MHLHESQLVAVFIHHQNSLPRWKEKHCLAEKWGQTWSSWFHNCPVNIGKQLNSLHCARQFSWWWWICEALRTFGAFAWMCSTWSPSNKIKQARLCFTRRDLCTLPSYETLRADWPSSRLAVDGWMDKKWHEKIVRFLILRKKLICAAFLKQNR